MRRDNVSHYALHHTQWFPIPWKFCSMQGTISFWESLKVVDSRQWSVGRPSYPPTRQIFPIINRSIHTFWRGKNDSRRWLQASGLKWQRPCREFFCIRLSLRWAIFLDRSLLSWMHIIIITLDLPEAPIQKTLSSEVLFLSELFSTQFSIGHGLGNDVLRGVARDGVLRSTYVLTYLYERYDRMRLAVVWRKTLGVMWLARRAVCQCHVGLRI
jgi:hypothetical protein